MDVTGAEEDVEADAGVVLLLEALLVEIGIV